MSVPLELGGINDPDVRRALETLGASLGELRQLISFGVGVPGSAPSGRGLYLDLAGGGGTTLYVWEGAAWVGK